ncbi:MAG TPA: hypothetical protein VGB53_11460, partial [Rubricoccaceae bacterium]
MRRHGRDATAEQTLNSGLRHWIAAPEAPEAGVAYAVSRALGRPVWVTAGGPVCALHARRATAAAFEEAARATGATPVWFGIDARTVRDIGPGHTALVVGAEPVWTPARWAETVDA